MKELYLTTRIDTDVVKRLGAELARLSADDEVDLIIDSPGGEIVSAVFLADMVDKCPAHITCRVAPNGACDSAAVLILAAGDWRQCRQYSTCQLHSAGVDYLPDAMLPQKIEAQLQGNVNYALCLSKYTGVDLAHINRLMADDAELQSNDLFQLNVVDEVLDSGYSPALDRPRQQTIIARGYRGGACVHRVEP